MYILGFGGFRGGDTHDSSVSLIKDGRIMEILLEERFNRIKKYNKFPKQALTYIFNKYNLDFKTIDYIAVYYEKCLGPEKNPYIYKYKLFPDFQENLPSGILDKIFLINHVDCHAAAVFYPSYFEKSSILILEGGGDLYTGGVFYGDKYHLRKIRYFDFPASLGGIWYYTTKYLGFKPVGEEGKVMALSSYGQPEYFKDLSSIIQKDSEFVYSYDTENIHGYIKELTEKNKNLNSKKQFKFRSNVACSIQKLTEEMLFNYVDFSCKRTNSKNICLAGGVMLNCQAVGKIKENTIAEKIYINPNPGDEGAGFGAALYLYHHLLGNFKRDRMITAYHGYEENDKDELFKILDKFNLKYEKIVDLNKVVKIILNQKIIGLFQGRAECGNRALGNRSIIADPGNIKIKDRINSSIKKREFFQPFAPVVLAEYAEEYFDITANTEFMSAACRVYSEKVKEIPAIVHYDKTARIQTVTELQNSFLYNLINKYYEKTGVPMLLNTSFNGKGEPIVNSYSDAVNCFLKNDIDYLIIEGYLIYREGVLTNIKNIYNSFFKSLKQG